MNYLSMYLCERDTNASWTAKHSLENQRSNDFFHGLEFKTTELKRKTIF